jgi:hypothetical protein
MLIPNILQKVVRQERRATVKKGHKFVPNEPMKRVDYLNHLEVASLKRSKSLTSSSTIRLDSTRLALCSQKLEITVQKRHHVCRSKVIVILYKYLWNVESIAYTHVTIANAHDLIAPF